MTLGKLARHLRDARASLDLWRRAAATGRGRRCRWALSRFIESVSGFLEAIRDERALLNKCADIAGEGPRFQTLWWRLWGAYCAWQVRVDPDFVFTGGECVWGDRRAGGPEDEQGAKREESSRGVEEATRWIDKTWRLADPTDPDVESVMGVLVHDCTYVLRASRGPVPRQERDGAPAVAGHFAEGERPSEHEHSSAGDLATGEAPRPVPPPGLAPGVSTSAGTEVTAPPTADAGQGQAETGREDVLSRRTGSPAVHGRGGAKPAADADTCVPQGKGVSWYVRVAGEEATVPDCIGMRHLRRLIEHPNEEFYCTELSPHGLVQPEGSGDRLMTLEANQECDRRLKEIERDAVQAIHEGNSAYANSLLTEAAAIQDQQHKAIGPHGRPCRELTSSADKARKRVCKAIRTALRKIKGQNGALGRLLDRDIRTGATVSYKPPSRTR